MSWPFGLPSPLRKNPSMASRWDAGRTGYGPTWLIFIQVLDGWMMDGGGNIYHILDAHPDFRPGLKREPLPLREKERHLGKVKRSSFSKERSPRHCTYVAPFSLFFHCLGLSTCPLGLRALARYLSPHPPPPHATLCFARGHLEYGYIGLVSPGIERTSVLSETPRFYLVGHPV